MANIGDYIDNGDGTYTNAGKIYVRNGEGGWDYIGPAAGSNSSGNPTDTTYSTPLTGGGGGTLDIPRTGGMYKPIPGLADQINALRSAAATPANPTMPYWAVQSPPANWKTPGFVQGGTNLNIPNALWGYQQGGATWQGGPPPFPGTFPGTPPQGGGGTPGLPPITPNPPPTSDIGTPPLPPGQNLGFTNPWAQTGQAQKLSGSSFNLPLNLTEPGRLAIDANDIAGWSLLLNGQPWQGGMLQPGSYTLSAQYGGGDASPFLDLVGYGAGNVSRGTSNLGFTPARFSRGK